MIPVWNWHNEVSITSFLELAISTAWFHGHSFYDKEEGFIFVFLGKVMTGSGNAVVLFSVCFSFRFTGEMIIGASCCCGTPSLWKTYTWLRQKCNRQKHFLQATLKNTRLQAGGFKTLMRACEAQEGRRLRLRGLNKEHSLGHFY